MHPTQCDTPQLKGYMNPLVNVKKRVDRFSRPWATTNILFADIIEFQMGWSSHGR